ncbi:MAG: hypothetical protein HOV79_03830 [Hamadaea sp.]|nr:hypothetical protein [Hamadaea sp.]
MTVHASEIPGQTSLAAGASWGPHLVEHNYVHTPNFAAAAAADGDVDLIRVSGSPAPGHKLVIRHNAALNQVKATSALGLHEEAGTYTRDVLIGDNFLAGGAYSFSAGGDSAGLRNVGFRDNVFGRTPKSVYGPAALWKEKAPGIVWQNIRFEGGKVVSAP